MKDKAMNTPKTVNQILADASCKRDLGASVDSYIAAVKNEVDNIVSGRIDPATQADLNDLFTSLRASKSRVASALTANTPHDLDFDEHGKRVNTTLGAYGNRPVADTRTVAERYDASRQPGAYAALSPEAKTKANEADAVAQAKLTNKEDKAELRRLEA